MGLERPLDRSARAPRRGGQGAGAFVDSVLRKSRTYTAGMLSLCCMVPACAMEGMTAVMERFNARRAQAIRDRFHAAVGEALGAIAGPQ